MAKPTTACSIEHAFLTTLVLLLRVQHSPKEWRYGRSTITFWNIFLDSEKYVFYLHSLHSDGRGKETKYFLKMCSFCIYVA
jgi:hypothetical protein